MLINFRPKPHQDKLNPNLSNQFKISVNQKNFPLNMVPKIRILSSETDDKRNERQNGR